MNFISHNLTSIRVSVLCLLSSTLCCCKEDKPPKDTIKPVQQITKGVHILKEHPKPPPEEKNEQVGEKTPVINIPEIVFPSIEPLKREQNAQFLRGERQHRLRSYRAQPQIEIKDKKEWYLSDLDYQQWEQKYGEDRSTYPVDRSRILTADMRIPAILEDSVNSQIPGRLIAVVDRDIYSPNGQKILIPAYSKLICTYTGLDEETSTRLPAQCHRLIRPDGVSVLLTDATASDQVGRSGLIGNMDFRTLERYGTAFSIALLSALAQSSSSISDQPVYNNAASQLSNSLGQVTAKVLEQKLKLTPILTIPSGTRIQIIPMTDIVFRAPVQRIIQQEKGG